MRETVQLCTKSLLVSSTGKSLSLNCLFICLTDGNLRKSMIYRNGTLTWFNTTAFPDRSTSPFQGWHFQQGACDSAKQVSTGRIEIKALLCKLNFPPFLLPPQWCSLSFSLRIIIKLILNTLKQFQLYQRPQEKMILTSCGMGQPNKQEPLGSHSEESEWEPKEKMQMRKEHRGDFNNSQPIHNASA
jgi:hypothetical protein